LAGQRDQADLGEIEMEGLFDHRINRGDERLDGVIEQMGKADGQENRHDRFLRRIPGF
jgi:hypothetical protein